MNSTPRCASETSPGRGLGPPPRSPGQTPRGEERERAAPKRAHVRQGATRRRSGCASPRAPPRARASGECPAVAGRASSSRFPGAHQQEVVRACCGDLERAPGALLAAQIGEIRNRGVLDALVDRLEGRRVEASAEVLDGLGEMPNTHRLDSRESRFRRRLGGAHNDEVPRDALPRRRRACPRRGGSSRRAPARPGRRARRAARAAAASSRPGRRARSGGRIPTLPSKRRGREVHRDRRLTGHSNTPEKTPLRTRCFAS